MVRSPSDNIGERMSLDVDYRSVTPLQHDKSKVKNHLRSVMSCYDRRRNILECTHCKDDKDCGRPSSRSQGLTYWKKIRKSKE